MSLIIGPWPGSGDESARRVQPSPQWGLPLGHEATVGSGDVAGGWCYQVQVDVLVVDGVCSGCGQPVVWPDGGDDA